MATLDTFVLPDDLLWIDEFLYSPVAQSRDISLAGSLIVQSMIATAGRPVTLSGDADYAWATRQLVQDLSDYCATDPQMVLTLTDGRVFNVRFLQPDGSNPGAASSTPPIEAKPVVGYSDPGVADPYTIIIRLFKV